MRRIATACTLAVLATAAWFGNVGPAAAAAAILQGFEEVPAISSSGQGKFQASIVGSEIRYRLSYRNLEGNVLQAHIHFGQEGVNGGIAAFLCTNLGNGPPDTPPCPSPPATVTGVITADEVVGPGDQGIEAGEFHELVRAIRRGVTYINVHSDLHPSGELRGQMH